MAGLNCSKCGGLKVGSYVAESWCGKCIGERKKELRAKRRAEKGLPPIGSGRDPKCKKCHKLKEESYQDGSWCRECKLANEKRRYEENLKKFGKCPRAYGRNPICIVCHNEKEEGYLNSSYCKKCTTERKRRIRQEKMQDPVYRNMVKEKEREKSRADIQIKIKRACRSATNRAIAFGKLVKQPCEVCGVNENIDAHHDDYTDPLNIRWLCKTHHMQHHKSKSLNEECKHEC